MSAPARWPLVLALALSAVAIATLLWLRHRLVEEERGFLDYAVRLYEISGALLRPEDDALRFSEVDSVARSVEERSLVRRLVVTKMSERTAREHSVYPFWQDTSEPDWREHQEWSVLDVNSPAGLSGRLYVSLDKSGRLAIDLTVAAFAFLLVTCLGILVTRQHGKEVELGRTHRELEQRKAEVTRLERLALAGQLTANMLHDLRKPVLNIKHEIADRRGAGECPSDSALLMLIEEQSELFLSMLRDLGIERFVHSENEDVEYCDLRDLVDRSIALVRYESDDIKFLNELPCDGSLPLVLARPHRLIQVYSNLFLNACQAIAGSGSVMISGECEGGSVVVRVRDTGPGIPPQMRGSLFEPFATTRSESGGSGLGLYISSTIMSDTGGSLSLSDGGGTGAEFLLRFPIPDGG